jgi:hypothetical protein
MRRVAETMGLAFRDRLGPMFVGTIHAFCFRVLQDHVPRYCNYGYPATSQFARCPLIDIEYDPRGLYLRSAARAASLGENEKT